MALPWSLASGHVPICDPCKVRIALVGDVHGQFSVLLRALERWELALADNEEAASQRRIDFVLQVGDLECHRSEADMITMAAPASKRQLGDFPRVVSGELRFRWPFFFIGGNHECYGWLDSAAAESGPARHQALQVAPNMFYLGRAGYLPLRLFVHSEPPCIAGVLNLAFLSGIHCPDRFYERRPRATSERFAERSNKDWIGFNCYDLAMLGHDDTEVAVEREPSEFDFYDGVGPDAAAAAADELENEIASRACTVLNVKDPGVKWRERVGNLVLTEPEAKLLLRSLTRAAPSHVNEQYSKLAGAVATTLTLSALVDQVARRLREKRSAGKLPEGLLRRRNCVDILLTHDWPAGLVTQSLRGSRPMGNEPCRELSEELAPRLHACGHMHHAHRATIPRAGGPETQVCALAKVGFKHAVAVMEVDLHTGTWTELEGPCGPVEPLGQGDVEAMEEDESDVDPEGETEQ